MADRYWQIAMATVTYTISMGNFFFPSHSKTVSYASFVRRLRVEKTPSTSVTKSSNCWGLVMVGERQKKRRWTGIVIRESIGTISSWKWWNSKKKKEKQKHILKKMGVVDDVVVLFTFYLLILLFRLFGPQSLEFYFWKMNGWKKGRRRWCRMGEWWWEKTVL